MIEWIKLYIYAKILYCRYLDSWHFWVCLYLVHFHPFSLASRVAYLVCLDELEESLYFVFFKLKVLNKHYVRVISLPGIYNTFLWFYFSLLDFHHNYDFLLAVLNNHYILILAWNFMWIFQEFIWLIYICY